MRGDKYCLLCGDWIGNYITGDVPDGYSRSYYSIIRRKYCNDCRPWKRAGDNAFKQREYRKRVQAAHKQRDKLLRDVIEENKKLRQMLIDKS